MKFSVFQSLLISPFITKKQIRDENIKNFIKILKVHLTNSKEMSVFSGKIGVFNKKICINLS